jgi:hypothetical protein
MAKTMMFNPYTGTPRHPSDIASDPAGLLILDDGEPLRAAPPQAQQAAPHPDTQDAERYRWLRDEADYMRVPEGSPQVCLTDEWGNLVSIQPWAYPRGGTLDAAIDKARGIGASSGSAA